MGLTIALADGVVVAMATAQRPIQIRPMRMVDHAAALRLWRANVPAVYPSPLDERAPIARYLRRNPGLSQVAYVGKQFAGVVLAGHDGRYGDLHHLAVVARFRRRGLAAALVTAAETALRAEGITMCVCHVYRANRAGTALWKRLGYETWTGCPAMSKALSSRP